MNAILNMSRRTFLQGSLAAGGLVLGARMIPGVHGPVPVARADTVLNPNLFVSIDTSGTVTIVAHRSEMGTGIRTSLPMIVADELEADWSRVTIEQAVGDAMYGDQNTDGSRSVVQNYQRLREFGATARTMLEQAAAQLWEVDLGEVGAENHRVVHTASGRSLDYGELVETAAGLSVPDSADVTLKDPADFRYIGKDIPIVDLQDIIRGKAQFGVDVVLPGMKYASVEHCPVALGKIVSYDASETLAVPGVEQVVEIPAAEKPVFFQPLGGLAVVASNTWAAIEGRKKLKIEWDYGENASYDSAAYRQQLEDTARQPGRIAREEGNIEQAFTSAAQTVEALYYVPHLAHASMEPPAAAARIIDGHCEVWSCTQNPQAARSTVAAAIGFDEADVTARVTLLGGAFGRKSKPDFAAEAAVIAKAIDAPVKVTWTREDDIRNGYFHAVSAQYVRGALDENGRTIAWHHRTVFPPIASTFAPTSQPGSWELDFGLTDLPYAVPNLCIESGEAEAHVRIGWLRSVQNIYHAFAVNSFANELAAAAGRDPLEYLLELIGEPRHVDPDAGGAEYSNYGQPLDIYPIDTGRLAHVLKLAAERIDYGRELPAREGIGLAVHRSFLSYIATAVHVAVAEDGKLSIPRVVMAVDAGRIIHPERVRAQMEGATIYGMSLACYGNITAREGRIEQGNYDSYPVVRMADAPRRIDVHLVASDAPPGGVGEPGTPPFAPALCNAVFAATGRRIRELPLNGHDLSA